MPVTDMTPIRDAATVILIRDRDTTPRVLMGQRGAKAVFMPSKFVFPGGAVDTGDAHVPLTSTVSDDCAARLALDTPQALISALQVAAVREVWEETGLILGTPGTWHGTPPEDWADFAATGHIPSAEGFRYVFRAITPPGRPRRFDARFFMVGAEAVASDIDDFSRASDELSQLQWIALDEVRSFDLPFITEVVLAEVAEQARSGAAPETVPFFKNNDEESLFLRIGKQNSTG